MPYRNWATPKRNGTLTPTYRASWNGATLAESEHTIRVGGNQYFPPESLNRELSSGSPTTPQCPWKGSAKYYTVTVDGVANPDAAWYYPQPSHGAENIRDHVAFWNGVKVAKVADTGPRGDPVRGLLVAEADRTTMKISATTPIHSIAGRLRVGSVVALAMAIGWFLLAVTHPTITYHFDPFLVVIAPVALTRFRSTGPLPWWIVLAGSGIGTSLALATTTLLDGAGALRGPTLIGTIGPVAEALIAILLGVAIEVVSTLIRRARDAR